MSKNFYNILGFDYGDKPTEQEVRRAYRRLALTSHPDKNLNDPLAKEKFQHIQDAYERVLAHLKLSGQGIQVEVKTESNFRNTNTPHRTSRPKSAGKNEKSRGSFSKSRSAPDRAKSEEFNRRSRGKDYQRETRERGYDHQSGYKTSTDARTGEPKSPCRPDSPVDPEPSEPAHPDLGPDPWEEWTATSTTSRRDKSKYRSPYPTNSLGDKIFDAILSLECFWEGPTVRDDDIWIDLVLRIIFETYGRALFHTHGLPGEKGRYLAFKNRGWACGRQILVRFLEMHQENQECNFPYGHAGWFG
jgi:curved DNA-binding protein CbpA